MDPEAQVPVPMRRRLADRRGNPTIDAGPLPVDFMSHPPEIDPNGIGQHEPGAKLDAGKLRPWLCIGGFSRALEEVAKVTTVGARKYSPNGWKAVPDGKDRYMDAAVRHMIKCGQGEKVDRDTGCLHHAQVIWNLLASLELELQEREEKAG